MGTHSQSVATVVAAAASPAADQVDAGEEEKTA